MKFQLHNACEGMGLRVSYFNMLESEADLEQAERRLTNLLERRLRFARLYKSEDEDANAWLRLTVSVYGHVYAMRIEYLKDLYDPSSATTGVAGTWSKSTLGTAGDDQSLWESKASKHVDDFLTEFLSVNADHCGEAAERPDKEPAKDSDAT
ncbi:MAG: hypothetical protein OXQ84_09450 [bacterium]|nr:hypothetical protein [bacterium]